MKKVVLLSVISGLSLTAFAQDAVFNQYTHGAIYLNPALAGSANSKDGDAAVRVGTQYRNQWGRDIVFNTGLLYYDQSVGNGYGNVGFYALQDKAGDGGFTTTQANAVYAYQTPFKRGRWAAQYGLSLGYRSQGIQLSKLRFEDQIDYTQGTVKPTSELIPANRKANADVAAGAVFFNKFFQVGLAIHNITQPSYDYIGVVDNRVPMRFTLHSGGVIVLRNVERTQYTALHLQGLVMKQGNFSQINAAVSLVNNEFQFGIGHRRSWYFAQNADAITFNLGIVVKNLYINYTYEQTVSQLKSWSPRTNELGIALRLRKSRYAAPTRPGFPL